MSTPTTFEAMFRGVTGNVLTDEAVRQLVRNPDVVKHMLNEMRKHEKFRLMHGLWTIPRDQIKKIKELNEKFFWGFTEEDFSAAEKQMPAWPHDKKEVALVLTPYFQTGRETLDHLLKALAQEKQFQIRYGNKVTPVHRSEQSPLTVREAATFEPISGCRPGLWWEVIDFQPSIDDWQKVNDRRPSLRQLIHRVPQQCVGLSAIAAFLLHDEVALGYKFGRSDYKGVSTGGGYRRGLTFETQHVVCPGFGRETKGVTEFLSLRFNKRELSIDSRAFLGQLDRYHHARQYLLRKRQFCNPSSQEK